MTRIVVPLVLALAAALCAVEGLHRPSPGSPLAAAPPVSAGPGATVGPPVLAVARVPAVLTRLGAEQRLATAMDAIWADPAVARWQACAEVDDAGVPAYVRNGASALIPASNLKLLTAAAALARLGPSATFVTTAAAAAAPAGGVVAGPLYLVGGGDPLLATDGYRASQHQWTESREPVTRLAALADAVRAAGVTRIGGIVADDHRYDAERSVPGWSPSYAASGEITPVGALIVDGGTVVAGRRRVPAADPAVAAAEAFASLLSARGVEVGGPVVRGAAPPAATTVATVTSPPLTTVLGEMLRESDNLAAEMLVKELGFRFGGGGTWPAGTAVVHATLAGEGIPLDGVVQIDGSGLARQDRVPCRTLAALVAGGSLAPELPVAARCGTLVSRLVGQPGGQRVVAKTGSLSGVVALSGAVAAAPLPPDPCPPGGASTARVTFAVVLNETPSITAGEAVADHVANLLAIYAGGA